MAAGLRPRYGAAVGTAAGLVDCPAMRIPGFPGFPACRAGNFNLAILFLLSVAFCMRAHCRELAIARRPACHRPGGQWSSAGHSHVLSLRRRQSNTGADGPGP